MPIKSRGGASHHSRGMYAHPLRTQPSDPIRASLALKGGSWTIEGAGRDAPYG